MWLFSRLPRVVRCVPSFRSFCSEAAAVATVRNAIAEYTAAVSEFAQAPLQPSGPCGREREVFVNHEVRMDHIDVVGFDLDYTLASYNVKMQELVYELARDYLINILHYPSAFRSMPYDPQFGIRGILYDMNLGVLLKLDYHDNITPNCAFRGRSRLSTADVVKLYNGVHVPYGYRERHMKALVDMFSMPEGCLVANLVQYFHDNHTEFSNRAVAEDISKAISFVHTSGAMHNHVAVNPEVYLDRNEDLPALIKRLKDDGIQVFLLTNSSYMFANAVLQYLIGDDWRAYFNVVMVDANKPNFYNSSKPFREVDTTRARVKWDEVTALRPGRVYAQGSVADLMTFQGWKGSRVLYIGDNMLSDSIVPRKTHGWVTGVILPELERHMQMHESSAVRNLDTQLLCLDEIMRTIQQGSLREHHGKGSILKPEARRLLMDFLEQRSLFASERVPFLDIRLVSEFLDVLEAERNAWRKRKQLLFHNNFGSEFTSGTSPTLFAMSVMRYVDLYTSRVTNFLQYPGDFRFYPEVKLLPHQQPSSSVFVEEAHEIA